MEFWILFSLRKRVKLPDDGHERFCSSRQRHPRFGLAVSESETRLRAYVASILFQSTENSGGGDDYMDLLPWPKGVGGYIPSTPRELHQWSCLFPPSTAYDWWTIFPEGIVFESNFPQKSSSPHCLKQTFLLPFVFGLLFWWLIPFLHSVLIQIMTSVSAARVKTTAPAAMQSTVTRASAFPATSASTAKWVRPAFFKSSPSD